MACSNCFNGCVDIISDQCVRYTGIDVPALGILTGDPLSRVEESLTTFLVSALDGTGIKPYVNPEIICPLVSANLPTCGELTIVDLITGLIKSVCDLQEQIDVIIVDVAAINATLATLNSTYTTSCLTGTIDAESTHSVLQALITNFCALVASLPNTYVALVDINQIISDWVTTYYSNTLISARMVPYAAVPYFGPLSYFGSTGEGLGIWNKIYLCNGENTTPDLRGRTIVGCTDMGGAIPINPALATPIYTPRSTEGANTVGLSIAQMPSHSHTATVAPSVTQAPPHTHFLFNTDLDSSVIVTGTTYSHVQSESGTSSYNYTIQGSATVPTLGISSPASTNVGVTATATIASNGGGAVHENIQPSMGAYYIIYIP